MKGEKSGHVFGYVSRDVGHYKMQSSCDMITFTFEKLEVELICAFSIEYGSRDLFLES